MPLILPGNVASATASTTYNVANSCRFNDGDAPKMTLTPGSNGSATKFTFSCWVKRGTNFGAQQYIMLQGSGSTLTHIKFDGNDKLDVQGYESGTAFYNLSNRVFRDPGAWYHIVVAIDTTQGTAGNRVKIYVNGTEETSWASETIPDEDKELAINNTSYAIVIGAETSSNYFDGYLAEMVYIDGTQYAASDFGEFDSDSPTIWKPKDPSGLTFGTNGFYLDFEASDNLGNDANGGTDFTETNLAAVDQATDSPTNNFCTGNPLDNYYQDAAYTEGNCVVLIATAKQNYSTATMGMTAGKWYWEIQGTTNTGGFQVLPGIAGRMVTSASEQELGEAADTYAYYSTDGKSYTGGSGSTYGDTFAADDIISVAVDLDNNKLYFAKNGTWQNSGDPTTGATGTGAISISAASATTMGLYLPAWTGGWGGSVGHYGKWNFGGCPAFAISSAAADGNGYGAFEYAPPSGYLALCTKNLGSDGG